MSTAQCKQKIRVRLSNLGSVPLRDCDMTYRHVKYNCVPRSSERGLPPAWSVWKSFRRSKSRSTRKSANTSLIWMLDHETVSFCFSVLLAVSGVGSSNDAHGAHGKQLCVDDFSKMSNLPQTGVKLSSGWCHVVRMQHDSSSCLPAS